MAGRGADQRAIVLQPLNEALHALHGHLRRAHDLSHGRDGGAAALESLVLLGRVHNQVPAIKAVLVAATKPTPPTYELPDVQPCCLLHGPACTPPCEGQCHCEGGYDTRLSELHQNGAL